MPSESFYTAARPDPAIKIKPDRLAKFSSVACPRCRGYHTTRAHRRSFFQKFVLFRLGYFPWKCIDCNHRFFSQDRGHNLR
jgi:DNA-directed RNA polymerase subunit RPC12/RpoP